MKTFDLFREQKKRNGGLGKNDSYTVEEKDP